MNVIIKKKDVTSQKILTSCINIPAQEMSLDRGMEIKYSSAVDGQALYLVPFNTIHTNSHEKCECYFTVEAC